ncbi:hypothetical protein F4561_005595 [Lipingzhangella halophila]|uniref:4Fe-4S Wbl-type domain-containing protein n=1 Tax=Lipingzhangella halophila TaxID=1783352 RepID=A0A7W7W0H8_9ACTN|nr:WhiB family transcriptional regulator [Lipingzhangella halophila]MBB4929203.1 hypothetical protein [Lipingzhangella halophila]MBB4934701.1 hypothetical protein [Lipingzhangella halophila]
MRADPNELSTDQLYVSIVSADPPCRADPELFFEPDQRESKAQRALREQSAAALCLECPVYWLCLAYAVRTRPEHGIYAGYTPDEIQVFAKVYGPAA